jgi:type I restriction enzyme S subunit
MSREMVNSGIPWIGDIPKEWKVCQVKNLFTISRGRVIPITDMDDSFKYPVYSSQTKDNGCMGYISTFDYKEEALTWTTDGANAGTVFYRNGKFNCTNVCGVLQLKDKCSFIKYMLYSVGLSAFNSRRADTNGYKIMSNEMAEIQIIVPHLVEQQKIASFLDKKCAEVDEMITLQEKIIEELKAYKQSVITEAVTKGLNPNVPMKDSGIEWIGEIPEYWNVTKLKRIVKVSDGTHDTPEYIDKDRNSYPLVTSRCIVDGEIDISLAHHISEQDYIEISKRSAVSKYDVIMPMIGTVGNPAILMTDDKIAIKNVALFRTYGDLDKAKYIKYYLNSLLVKEQFNFTFRGGVQNFVSQDIIKNLLFLMPEDYREVVNLLDTKCTEIDNLISIKLSKIDSLKEYKKSIIYEYVTGKKEVI